MELGHAQLGVLRRCQAGELAGERSPDRRQMVAVLLVVRGHSALPPPGQDLGSVQAIKLADIIRAVERAVEEVTLTLLVAGQQDRHQAGLLLCIRERGPGEARVRYR